MYIHDKNDLKTYVIKYIICLIPLYIYGFYKNGYLLYINNYTNILGMFKIFYLLILAILIYFITNKILKKSINIDITFLSIFLIPLFCPVNINLGLYSLVMFIFLLFRKFMYPSFIIVILSLLGKFSTSIDDASIYSFNILDLLWGKNIGGIGSTSIILACIIFITLSIINDHKYIVSLSSLFSFILLSIIFKKYFLLTSGNAILTMLFITSLPNKSPILTKNMIIYGQLVGIVGFILCVFVSPYYGMSLATFILSLTFCFKWSKYI